MGLLEKGSIYSFSWHLCEVINSSIGFIIIIVYLLLKKERYRGNGRYINRIVLLISIFGVLEMTMRTFEVLILNNTDDTGSQKTSLMLCLIHRFIFLFAEIINAFLITLIAISLFLVTVLSITVVELETHEYTAYLITGLVSIICTIIGFIKARYDENLFIPNVGNKNEEFYNYLNDYFSREAITINEFNCTFFFVLLISFLIFLNGFLYATILIKCVFPFGKKKYFKSSPVNYVITLMGYYIVFIIKWIGFLIMFYFGKSNYKSSLIYSFVTSITTLQGFLNFIVFMIKPIYRYSCFRNIHLINKFKSNEKEALKEGKEVSIENYRILESLNEDEDNNYNDKNTEINVIALTLFQMVLCSVTLLTNMGIILSINRNNKNTSVTIYTFVIILIIVIVLVCTYFGIISVVKNNLKNMKIYMIIQWIVLFIIVLLELFLTYMLLFKPKLLKEKIGCSKSKNKSNWQSCETSQVSLNLFNFIVMRHIMAVFNIYYLRYYNCNYSSKFKSLIFENIESDDNDDQMKLNYSPNDIYSIPVSDYESTIYLAVDDADENEQILKAEQLNKNRMNKMKGKLHQIYNVNAKVFNVDDVSSPVNINIYKGRYSNCSLNYSLVNATLNSSATITNSFLGKINNQNINNITNNNLSQETLNSLPPLNISNKRNTLLDDSSSDQNINTHSTLKNDTIDDSDSDGDDNINNNINKNMDNINNINMFKDNNIIVDNNSYGQNNESLNNSSNNGIISSEAYLDINYNVNRNSNSTVRSNKINCLNIPNSNGISYDTLISYKQAQENEKNRMRGIKTLSYVDIKRDIDMDNDLLKINNSMAKVARTSLSEHNTSFNINNSNNNRSSNYLFINNKLNPYYTSKFSEDLINSNIANESFSSAKKIVSINSYKSKRSSICSSSTSFNKYNIHLSSNIGNDKNSVLASSISSTSRVKKYIPIVPLKKSKKLDPHGDWWIEMALPIKSSSIQPSIVYTSKPSKPKSRSHSYYQSHAHFNTPSSTLNSNNSHNKYYSNSSNGHQNRHCHTHSHNHSDNNAQSQIYSLIGGASSSKKSKDYKTKIIKNCHYNRSLNNSQNSEHSIYHLNSPTPTSKYNKQNSLITKTCKE